MNPRTILLAVLSAVLLAKCYGAPGCSAGWFGKGCRYKCHCYTTFDCDSDGSCNRCQRGWFGPACQYDDLAFNQVTQPYTLYLTDGNDKSCVTPWTLQGDQVTVTLNRKYLFTWLRVHINDSATDLLHHLEVFFGPEANLPCTSPRNASLGLRTLDIHCDLDAAVQQVTLRGEAVRYLCSVYISGGRNVALKQRTTQSTNYSDYYETYTSDKAVDGNPSGDFSKRSCSSTIHEYHLEGKPQWSVTFDPPSYTSRYILYNRDGGNYKARLQTFYLQSFDKDNKRVFNYTDTEYWPLLTYTIIPPRVTSPVALVNIQSNHDEKILTLCEVEIYGDSSCDVGKYGRDCDHECWCAQQEQCFVSTGACPSGCAPGFYGESCHAIITTSATTTADTTNTTEASKTVRQDFECHLNYMHVFIPVELVPNSQLTLRELNCRLLNNGTHHKISFDYDECGTSQSFFEDYISIDNEVNVHNILNNTAEITFVEDYTIPLKCLVDRSKHVNGAIQVISRESIHENAVQSTDFHMKEFTTKDYDQEITEYPIQLPINREIFFEVALTNSSSNSTGIFVEKCEATPSIHRNGTVRVSLINFGCSVNPAVKVLPVPEIDRFRFSIQAFHFSGPENVDNMVYVHCSASTCGGVMCDNTCPKSSRRRRRSTRGQASATLTSGSHVVG